MGSLTPLGGAVGPSPRLSWSVIEEPGAVRAVPERLVRSARLDVDRRPDLYNLTSPGYPADAAYYIERGRPRKVLYLGVGTGRIFAPLADTNPEVVGLDVSRGLVDRVIRTHPTLQGRILCADAGSADLGDGRFDAVLAPYSFLQCLDAANARRVVRNTCRWLMPGGVFRTVMLSPYLIPLAPAGLEASVRSFGGGTRVAIYVRYDHLCQRMTEYALVERPGAADSILGLRLHYYFPREVHVRTGTCSGSTWT